MVVVGFLFMVVAKCFLFYVSGDFFVYGSGWVFVLMVVAVFFV